MSTKQAISISLGSTTRNKSVEIKILGQCVRLERRGTEGDVKTAARLFRELDGQADALGVGGIALYVNTPWKQYPLQAGLRLIKGVSRTPVTDGKGIQTVLEHKVMPAVTARLGKEASVKKAFVVEGLTRYGMMMSLIDAGYECIFGDLMFALGIPLPITTLQGLFRAAKILLPVVGILPASFLYSTGKSQEMVIPKYEKYYKEATVIAGDWLYIKKHMPADMEGKTIVTNTTTAEDVEFMRERGIKYLATTTPVFEKRSFGTNALEAALVAAAGKQRVLSDRELEEIIRQEKILPQIQELN